MLGIGRSTSHRSASPTIPTHRAACPYARACADWVSKCVRPARSEAGTFPVAVLPREDPDWDRVLSDVTERATNKRRSQRIRSVVPRCPYRRADWPPRAEDERDRFRNVGIRLGSVRRTPRIRETILDDVISTGADDAVAWFVIETIDDLRWGDVPSLRATNYTLVVMHLDRVHGLLYVHGSDTKRDYGDLVGAVLGHDPVRVNGYQTFRVFANLDRLIPTNIGLLDARDRDKRFSMYVGSDVETALTEAERSPQLNTHVAARAFDHGDRVAIAASTSGRFWSARSAENLAEWCQWCEQQGASSRRRHRCPFDVPRHDHPSRREGASAVSAAGPGVALGSLHRDRDLVTRTARWVRLPAHRRGTPGRRPWQCGAASVLSRHARLAGPR